jgi:fluoride exporter
MTIVWLLLSGGLGTVVRYWLFSYGSLFPQHAYIATLGVNVFGCLLFGIMYGLCERYMILASYRTIILTGFLGGFTTFSAYAGEAVILFLMQRYASAVGYIVLSNVCSLAAVYGGLVGIRLLVK